MTPDKKNKRSAYDASFKLKVVQHAEKCNNNRKTAAEFGISEKQVRDWRKIKLKLLEMPRHKKARRGQQTAFVTEENDLKNWIINLRQDGYIVTRSAIRLKAKELITDPSFKASAGWCTRFMCRHRLTIRQKTKICQKLPADLDDKIISFQRFVIRLRKTHQYPLSQIGNMDETPMFFYLPSNRTVDSLGNKTITIKTTGHERTHFTTVLCCMADGTKLPPMVIFMRKTIPKEKFPPGVIIHVHPKGWMDENGMLLWLQKIWARRPNGILQNKRSLIVWDMFRAHLVDRVKQCVTRGHNTDLAVIPGGLTSVLQPLDVSLNHPFKCRVHDQWTRWMSSGAAELTTSGNFKRPPLSTVVTWVKTAWDSIEVPMIEKSFKKCAISNNLDGTEDDILWSEAVNDSNEDNEDTDEGEEIYDDVLTDEQARKLFEDSSDEEEFFGF